MEPMSTGHLSTETLARLVDDPLLPEEEFHLSRCTECRGELDRMVAESRALAKLPLLRPPRDGWAEVERRLAAEGLLRAGEVPPARGSRPWLRTAASFLLFASGVATGWGFATRAPTDTGAGASELEPPPPALSSEFAAADDPAAGNPAIGDPAIGDPATGTADPAISTDPALVSTPLREAERLVQATGDLYRSAVTVYRDELELSGQLTIEDPIGRYMALGNVLAATQEAVRSSPADPFLNGILITTGVEREATLRTISVVNSGGP